MAEDRDKWRKYDYVVANPWIEDGVPYTKLDF